METLEHILVYHPRAISQWDLTASIDRGHFSNLHSQTWVVSKELPLGASGKEETSLSSLTRTFDVYCVCLVSRFWSHPSIRIGLSPTYPSFLFVRPLCMLSKGMRLLCFVLSFPFQSMVPSSSPLDFVAVLCRAVIMHIFIYCGVL